jgi:hypothetical protein
LIGVAGRLAMFLRFLVLLPSFPVFVRHVDQEDSLGNINNFRKISMGRTPGLENMCRNWI